MPYLLQAAFWVGVIGTLVSAPLLMFLGVQGSFLTAGQFFASSPGVIFLLASLTFSLVYALQPRWRFRARTAGISAALLTFVGFTMWLAIVINLRTWNDNAWPSRWFPQLASFAVFGWLPIAGGWFAGWVVSRLPAAPAEERS
ncbi:MAG TPA: hypothetical protein VGO61_06370 [Steroidobacteraceae bacterium]|jgi:hypothetical protein|nr:hypothetical protein [Steroidobacteraceae bacterium]